MYEGIIEDNPRASSLLLYGFPAGLRTEMPCGCLPWVIRYLHVPVSTGTPRQVKPPIIGCPRNCLQCLLRQPINIRKFDFRSPIAGTRWG